jgi:hypothetical protein
MTRRSTCSFAFLLAVAWCCILGHAVHAQDTCDPDGSLAAACSDASMACQAECTDANDLKCFTDCGQALATCAQDIVENCVGASSNPCDPDGSLALACATAQSDCQAACAQEDSSNLDCFSACGEDLQKCANEIVNNCSGSANGGESPDDNGGEDPDNDGEEAPDDNGGGEDPGSDGGETPDDNGGGEAGDNDGEATPYDNDGGEDPDNDGGETPDGNGEDNGGGGAPQGGGVIDSPTTASSQESGNETSDAMITRLGKSVVFLIASLTLLCGGL